MTYEEAIRNINALNAVCGQKDFYDTEFEAALELAIEALEKQNPKMPVHIESFGTCMFMGDCPVCGEPVASYEEYCDKCGQALDWSDTK